MSHFHDFMGVTGPRKILSFVTGPFLKIIEYPCSFLNSAWHSNFSKLSDSPVNIVYLSGLYMGFMNYERSQWKDQQRQAIGFIQRVIDRGVTRGLIQGGKRSWRGPTGHPRRAISQHSLKKVRKDSKYGCHGCLYYLKNKNTPKRKRTTKHQSIVKTI